ncbi:MAG: hypothetical protein KC910_31265, partial [Candidatus Eremiobacteraeota bacterium]|nr:hypothetical protein [Candidatus Eremiobacteraeota bacterium]
MTYRKSPHLIFQAIGDETVVYDAATMKAHRLDATAAAILKNCDNEQALEGIEPARVRSTLATLAGLGLVQPDGSPPQTRRGFLTRSALALGIVSVAAPLPAAAASCTGTPCDQSATTLCSACNPPGCAGIFAQQYVGYYTGDVAGGAPFCSPGTGVGALSACDLSPHSVESNCNLAKTEADNASTGMETVHYYCCSNTAATCVSRFQCQFGTGNDG